MEPEIRSYFLLCWTLGQVLEIKEASHWGRNISGGPDVFILE